MYVRVRVCVCVCVREREFHDKEFYRLYRSRSKYLLKWGYRVGYAICIAEWLHNLIGKLLEKSLDLEDIIRVIKRMAVN